MYIKSILIENFRCIKSFQGDFSSSVNLFIGTNGAGKTTILDAIDILFSWFSARIRNKGGNGILLKDDDISHGAKHCKLEITLGDGTSWKLYRQSSKSRTPSEDKSQLQELTKYVNAIVEEADSDKDRAIPLFTSFFVHRRAIPTLPKKIHRKHALNKFDLYSLNRVDSFHAFFAWFKEREDIENERYKTSMGADNFEDHQLSAVRRAIKTMVSGYENIRVKRPWGFVVDKGGETFQFDQLSDGEKSYITLVADIARQLAMTHPSTLQDPLQAKGVVLIDEIDLHLHPKWQREVLPKLAEVFPNCQFVVSTHSPYVVSSIPFSSNIYSIAEGSVNPVDIQELLKGG